jgi:hypothetical protein
LAEIEKEENSDSPSDFAHEMQVKGKTNKTESKEENSHSSSESYSAPEDLKWLPLQVKQD